MRHFILSFTLAVCITGPALAKKPLTFEEARAIALETVPGVVVDTERSIHNGAVVFEFDIKQENGAVMDIEIDSATHEILELKVDTMATGSSLPDPALDEDDAKALAITYIEDTTSGLRAVEVLDIEYTIENRILAYVFKIRRGIDHYRLVMDANTGRIISSKETD